jgi:hypothetical protein
MERRLFPDGGYYLDNGASVCGPCHILAEQTRISPEILRKDAGIERVILPPHLYSDQPYDKWGNPLLPDGRRLRGELFFDESVQKILKEGGVLPLFTHWVKYPRTYHLPWSPGVGKDDRVLPNTKMFEGSEVVVTIKMDGENTTMYRDHIHARSVDSGGHPSRAYAKAIHGRIAHDIPDFWRVCVENLFAKHSIKYGGPGHEDLPSCVMGFSVWDEKNWCLGWDETLEWLDLLGLPHVPVLYEGLYDEKRIKEAFAAYKSPFSSEVEGYVIRLRTTFRYADFRNVVGKYVREGHVHTHGHWMRQRIEPNGFRGMS